MDPEKLVKALEASRWSLKQPTEAIAHKRSTQIQRRAKKDAKPPNKPGTASRTMAEPRSHSTSPEAA